MALFQDEQITQEQFNINHNLNKKDTFSQLGYDEIIKKRQNERNQRIADEKQWVNNLISPEKIQEWENKGSMTAIEVWNKKNKNELVPYMGTWKQGSKSFKVKDISEKLQNGSVVTPEERKQFEDFVLDLAEIQTRGYTFGGGAMNIGLETIPFMAEFGLGLLTTGGTSSFGASSSKISTKVLEKSLTKKISEGIAKTAYNATINPRTYAFTATRLPQQVRARMGDIMLSDSVAISPEGHSILKESEEKPAIAFMKSLALTNVEVASEMSGEMLVRPVIEASGKLSKVIAKPLVDKLPKGFSEKFVKLTEETTKLPFIKAVDELGFNGILEEIGEERVGDLLKFAFNIDEQEGYSFEQLLDAMFPPIEQVGQEALSFGVTGLGMHAVHNTLKSIPVVGEKYTKDGFLIDAGIFRVAGYDSYLDKRVKEELAKQGKKEDEIENAVEFSNRDDKVQFLKDVKADFDTKKEYDAKEFEKDLKRAEIEDKTFEKLTQAGVSQDIAFANSKLFGQFFKNFGADNIQAFDNWYNKFDTRYNVDFGSGKIFQQSATAGAENQNNLMMTHAMKLSHLSDVLESGSLIAPSFAITKKGAEGDALRKFGELLFIRNPKRINYQNDNIYDRDIYSPRMPLPHYDIPQGRTVDYYEYDSLKRSYQSDPKRFVEKWGETFDEMFKGAKKVLFLGYTPSGNRKYVPYTNENILKAMKKQGLVNKEGFDYGLSSLLSRFSVKQTNKQSLKDTSKKELGNQENLNEKYEEIKNEYDKLGDKVAEYYYDKYSFYEAQSEAFYAIAKNMKKTINELFVKELPDELKQEVKDFVEKAKSLPRSYFEAKPMREIDLSEFSHVLVQEGEITNEQKQGLEDKGIVVLEYKSGEFKEAVNNLETKAPNVYFQSAYHGTPHKFDEFSTENIGTGEGAQAHGWGLYFAEDKEVSESYRKRLAPLAISETEIYLNGKIVENRRFAQDLLSIRNFQKDYVVDKTKFDIKNIEERLDRYKNSLKTETDKEQIKTYKGAIKQLESEIKNETKYLNKIKNIKREDIEVKIPEAGQLFEVDIPEDEVLLEEQKKFSEQSDEVKKSLINLFENINIDKNALKEQIERLELEIEELENTDTNDIDYLEFQIDIKKDELEHLKLQLAFKDIVKYDYEGSGIYRTLCHIYNSEKEASLKLNEYGIKGIAYNGRADGRCYVVFDDKAIKVLNTFYQEEEETEKLIAGYTYKEVLDKMTELYDEIGKGVEKQEEEKLMAKIHVFEDAFEVAEHPEKFSNEDRRHEIMLNAYYIMNDQEIPSDYIEADAISTRTYNDLLKLHNEKKEKAEREYYGYFSEENNKNVITIMANSNASTALHELGHLFLNGLNELARVSPEAQKQLDAVNKWLNFSGEYTTEQHEKFARSFEAYLYKGKAPNSYLRQVFESFKEWLKAVYHHITDIENRGADISDEVQKLFDNMFGGDAYYEERKEATNLLRQVKNIARKEKLEKIPVRDDDTLSESERRHKNVSYDILSVATGKDVNYLKRIFETTSIKNGYGRRREVVEELLEKADDRITTSGGMREEWKEFYSDTGVSYENDEVGGDYELAEQALDVIINKAYFDPEKMVSNDYDERAKYYERIINDANRQYDVLLRTYKKGNRNVALSAIYEWIGGLDKEIKEDFENRFIFDSGIIERDEKIDKFDKAKRKILEKAMSLENQFSITKDEKYKELVTQIIKELNFLQPADKARLTVNILDVPSTSFLMSSLDNIMDIAKTMEDTNLRRELERKIHNELQGTKNVKKGGRTVGKYNYKTNKIFEELRELDRLSPEIANERRLEETRFASAEDNGLSYHEKIVNKFLSYKAGGRTFADTELMKELYDEILKIKLIGKSSKSELELQEKLSEEKDIEELIKIVQNKKDAKFLTKAYISGLGNLESTLNALFNKDIKERFGSEVLYAETQSQAWQHEQKEKFEQGVAKIYGLPQWCWDKKVLDYLSEKHTYTEFRRKYDAENNLVKVRNIDRTLTKMDIIQAYIWSKNEVLEKRLLNQFGEDTLEAMFDELSLEDVKFAELLMQTAQSFYPLVNKAFIKKYGLDLPRVSCYFPSSPERGSEVDMYNDYSSKSLNNGFTKARSGSELLPMDFHNPVTALYSHIDGVAKFAFMSESLDIANKRFKNNDLKRVIVNKYGEDAYRTLEQILMNVTYKKEATVFNGVNKVLDNMIGNWIQANVAVKPIVGLKQLLSANNYAVDMPYITWQAGFLKALAEPQKTIDYMMKIPYLKARFEGNFSNEFLKQTIENSAFAMSKKLKDACTMFIKLGDVGAIVFGGKPYIDYLIKEQGMSEEQAIKQFVLATNRTQQSSAISSLSNFQVNMTRNPLGKLFIAFKNSPQQYVRMCGDAIVSLANGDMTKQQCAKTLFQYGYLQPFLYAVATSGSLLRFLFTGDDDDLKGDAISSIFNFNADALPFLGEIYLYAMRKGVMKEKYLPQSTPLLGDIQREIARISKEDVTLSDYLEAVGYMGLHVGLGYNSKAIGTMGSGVGDIAKGEIGQGALKVFGYTDKRSKHIVGNEKKDKKKRSK